MDGWRLWGTILLGHASSLKSCCHHHGSPNNAQNPSASNGGCARPQLINISLYQIYSRLTSEAAFLFAKLLTRLLLLFEKAWCPAVVVVTLRLT